MTTDRSLPKVRSYRDLIVWQKSIRLAVESHRLARALPDSERYVLKDQIFRASVSVAANIAEGHGRLSKGDYARYLSIARGSLLELETLLHIAREVGHISEVEVDNTRCLSDEIGRMLWSLIKSLGTRKLAPRARSVATL
jgi:four helix bundle protein